MFPNRHVTMRTALRSTIGLVWLAGAAFNLFWTLRHSSIVTDALASDATFQVFRWFFRDIVGQAPAFWILVLIMTEFGLGLLTLGRGRWVRVGLVGSALFSMFLFFIIWPYTLMMGLYALLPLWLLRSTPGINVSDHGQDPDHAGLHITGSGA